MSREFVQIGPRRWRFIDMDAATPNRSSLPFPYVISDEMPATEQVDGRFYTSKSAFRAVGRRLGLTEVGNEKFKPRIKPANRPEAERARIDAIGRAAAQWRYGRRPKPPKEL